MTPEQAAVLLDTLETFDRRLSDIDGRFKVVEGHLADDVTASEEMAKSQEKLTGLYLDIDNRLSNIESLLSNYIEATKARERQARQTEEAARGLVSEVRKRLPEVTSG